MPERLDVRIYHPIAPLYNENSRILILGSFPSLKSRESNFFYGHPQNRFWRVIAEITGNALPKSIEEKKNLLFSSGIALYDVIGSCEIVGSSDSTIKNAEPTDISSIVSHSRIEKIFLNGKTAKKYYDRLIYPTLMIEGAVLPSTSPANAAFSFERLVRIWREEIFKKDIEGNNL